VRKSRKFRWFSAGGGGRLATFLVGHAVLAKRKKYVKIQQQNWQSFVNNVCEVGLPKYY